MSTILITTATNPPDGIPTLKMTSSVTRAVTAKASVLFWAASGINRIVIADATGSTLLNNDDTELLHQLGIETEQISYIQETAPVQMQGKGYG